MEAESSSEEGEGRDEEGEDAELSEGTEGSRQFSTRWGWVACIDAVSEGIRDSWDSACRLTALEFFNVLCYLKDKREEQERKNKLWARRN